MLFILLLDSSQDDSEMQQAVSIAFGMLVLTIVTGYGFRFRPQFELHKRKNDEFEMVEDE